MNYFPKQISLFGIQKSVSELLNGVRSDFIWENEWLDFLVEWYNKEDFIEVNTSGSTGKPKTIRLKKDFVAASALRTIQFFGLKPGDQILHCLPTQFIAGKLMVVRALIGELDLHVVDPSTDFEFLQSQSFKFAAMVPNQVAKWLNLQSATRNPELLLIGGSAIPQQLEEKLQQVTTQCYSSYGMTETATHIALRRLNGELKEDSYQCLEGINIALSENGSLQIKMPGLEHEFLQTNDLAKLEDERTFKLVGRTDQVIISGGIKFNPEQLEKKLEPFIVQPFFISSKPHDKLGQQIVLVVEATEVEGLKDQLLRACSDVLEKYEVPRDILFTDQLPRTENGKIRRIIQ